MANFRQKIILIAFYDNNWSSYQQCLLYTLLTICLIITKFGTVVGTRKWTIHCICNPFIFWTVEGGGGCFSKISWKLYIWNPNKQVLFYLCHINFVPTISTLRGRNQCSSLNVYYGMFWQSHLKISPLHDYIWTSVILMNILENKWCWACHWYDFLESYIFPIYIVYIFALPV